MPKRKTLGWIAFATALWWLWEDYRVGVKRAMCAGYVTIALTLAHIWAPK